MRIQIITTNTGYEVTDMQTGKVMGRFDSLQYAKDCKDELDDQLAHKYGWNENLVGDLDNEVYDRPTIEERERLIEERNDAFFAKNDWGFTTEELAEAKACSKRELELDDQIPF